MLGQIYEIGDYVKRDINKAVYYYSLASNNYDPNANFLLGRMYFNGINIHKDINKIIHYFTLASNRNHADAQLNLGLIFCEGIYVKQNLNKGTFLLIQSSKNRNIKAYFILGFFYHEGRIMKRNIQESIHFYKEASSFNDQYAKNNLGVIYKNGFNNELKPNINFAIELFNEAIHQSNDLLSMYNLASIFIFTDNIITNDEKIIDLLIKSFISGFYPSIVLLCLFLIKKLDFKINKIKEVLSKRIDVSHKLINSIIQNIDFLQLKDETIFQNKYNCYSKMNFLYNHRKDIISLDNLAQNDVENTSYINNISNEFYQGFGIDI